MTLVIDPKVALLKGVDPVQFCVFGFFLLISDADAGQMVPGPVNPRVSGRKTAAFV